MAGREAVAARFAQAAKTYDRWAALYRRIAERVVDLCAAGPSPLRILEIGCGTGILTELLARRFPAAEIVAIDAAEAMVEEARRRHGGGSRVVFQTADVFDFGDGPFDLAASSAAFHWMQPLAALFERLYGLLVPAGRLAFALMLDGTLGELHAARRRAIPAKLVRSRLPRPGEVLAALAAGGFSIERAAEEEVRTHHGSALSLLIQLSELGVTGGAVSSSGARLTRGELAALVSRYEAEYREADREGVYATHRILYARAARGRGSP